MDADDIAHDRNIQHISFTEDHILVTAWICQGFVQINRNRKSGFGRLERLNIHSISLLLNNLYHFIGLAEFFLRSLTYQAGALGKSKFGKPAGLLDEFR